MGLLKQSEWRFNYCKLWENMCETNNGQTTDRPLLLYGKIFSHSVVKGLVPIDYFLHHIIHTHGNFNHPCQSGILLTCELSGVSITTVSTYNYRINILVL